MTASILMPFEFVKTDLLNPSALLHLNENSFAFSLRCSISEFIVMFLEIRMGLYIIEIKIYGH
jgi:hypothetical protein